MSSLNDMEHHAVHMQQQTFKYLFLCRSLQVQTVDVFLSLRGMRRRIVYCLFCRLHLSVALSTKSTKFGSRYLVDRLSEGHKIWCVRSLGFAVHQCGLPRLVNFGAGSPWGARILKGVKIIFVMLFSYIVWPRAVKFCTLRTIGA